MVSVKTINQFLDDKTELKSVSIQQEGQSSGALVKELVTMALVGSLSSKKMLFGQSIAIVEGPPAAMLGVILFDQARQIKPLNTLKFVLAVNLNNIAYYFNLNKDRVTLDKDDIIVEAKVAEGRRDNSKIIESQFHFLPVGTKVQIVYNQKIERGFVSRII